MVWLNWKATSPENLSSTCKIMSAFDYARAHTLEIISLRSVKSLVWSSVVVWYKISSTRPKALCSQAMGQVVSFWNGYSLVSRGVETVCDPGTKSFVGVGLASEFSCYYSIRVLQTKGNGTRAITEFAIHSFIHSPENDVVSELVYSEIADLFSSRNKKDIFTVGENCIWQNLKCLRKDSQ